MFFNSDQHDSSNSNDIERQVYSPIIVELDNEDSFVDFSPMNHSESPKSEH